MARRGAHLCQIIAFISDAPSVMGVLNLRLTCRVSLQERRFCAFTRRNVCAVESDLVEQYVGGDIARYISIADLKMASDCIHNG